MIQMRTLGTNDLTAADRPAAAGVLAQPKRFALLVYLAIAAPRGFVRRDALLALFWPETDQSRGRNVLRQTVFLLRQSLGSEAVISRGDEELRIDPNVVQCDVTQFETALAEGRTEEALELYVGDFLVGFHVADAAPEFEEWIQREARRLRALAADGAWTQAVSEEKSGSFDRAAQWARRSLSLDPVNQKRVTDVMMMLGRIGDRAGALQEFEAYARRADEDLGMQPPREVQRLADSLRSAPASSLAGEPVAVEQTPEISVGEDARGVVLPTLARPHSWLSRRRLASALLVAGLAVGAVVLRGVLAPATRPVLAIGAITDASVNGREPASNVPADLLSTSLARLTGLQVIPVTRLYDIQSQLRAARRPATSTVEASRHAGADQLIEGTLHRLSNGRLQLDLQVMDARNGTVVSAYRAEGSDLFGAIDQATALIAAAYRVAKPTEGIAQVATASLLAYRFYDLGLQAYYQEDHPAAYRFFRAALAEDSTFAMAAYYAGICAAATERKESGTLLLRAARLADRATDRERLLILERVAGLGMSATASALADTMAARYPLDPDAQFALGRVSERRGDFMAAARQYRRVIAMDSLSLTHAARCLACDAYEQLWWSYLYADSVAAAVRVARDFAAVRPAGGRALILLAQALDREGQTRDALTVWRTVDSLRAGVVNLDFTAATLSIRNGDFPPADERLRRLLREGGSALRSDAAWFLVLSLRNQGRHREALLLAEASDDRIRPIVLLEMGRSAEAAEIFESQTASGDVIGFPGHHARHQAWLLTHAASSLSASGDSMRLSQLADSVERMGKLSAFGRDLRLHHYIRGLLWHARGQPAQAAEEFRKSIWSWSEGYTRANYALAKTLLELKQPAKAVYPLQAALRGDLISSNLYISRTELHELLAQTFDALGQRDSAATHYRRVVDSWQRADASFTTRRNAAQARLKAITPG